jgi:putative FmdB family regulatory protein
MPLYEFHCPNGHDFEKFYRSIGTSSSEAECPVCGAIAERRMSAAGLVFKGSGFYITDYGKDGKKAERDAVTAAKTKTEAAESAKAAAEAKSPAPEPSAGESKATTTPKSESSAPTAAAQPAPAKPAAKDKSSA